MWRLSLSRPLATAFVRALSTGFPISRWAGKGGNFIPYSQLDAYIEEMSHIEDELVLHSVQLAASMKILFGRFKRQLRRQRTLSGLQIQMKNSNLLHLTLAFAASRPMSVMGLGCVKTPKSNLHVETSSRFRQFENQQR
jgi:hypothetical protein